MEPSLNEMDIDEIDLARTGMVFNVQKYSVHDGPGIRTIVFCKGCSLKCRWCSNPESQKLEAELAWNAGRCIKVSKCGHCISACKTGALTPGENDLPILNREKCDDCEQNCAKTCPAQGLIVYGKRRSVGDVLDAVEQDMAFYSRSGGGMTLSGGEPLLQKDFAVSLLRQARRRRMKTAVETCGMVPQDHVREAAPYLSNAMFDIKHANSDEHKIHTGAGNEQILNNFRILAEEFPKLDIRVRTPVIPGFNDSPEQIAAIAEIVKPYDRVHYEMLPYHRLGTQKYHFLHREPPMGDVSLDNKLFSNLASVARKILGDRIVTHN